MTANPGFLFTVLAFLCVIGPLIFVHELGHYLVGRWCGVKAEAFSIGFGPELAHWTDRRGTRWRLAALPLGGYVRFKGDLNASSQTDPKWLEMSAVDRAESFPAKAVWQRALIVAAGPVTNFLAAILLLGGLVYAQGDVRAAPVVGNILQGSGAEKGGLKTGDRIVEIMGRNIDTFADIPAIVQLRPGEPLSYVIERDGQRVNLTVTADTKVRKDRFGNEERSGQIGIAPGKLERHDVSLIEAPLVGAQKAWGLFTNTLDALGQIITGQRSVKDISGPLKMAQVSGEFVALGFGAYILLAAFISINLGFINLLPIPMLDGGHLLFYGIEAVQRKPVSERVQELAFRSGLALLMTLMLLVTINDLGSFGVWRGLTRLIG